MAIYLRLLRNFGSLSFLSFVGTFYHFRGEVDTRGVGQTSPIGASTVLKSGRTNREASETNFDVRH